MDPSAPDLTRLPFDEAPMTRPVIELEGLGHSFGPVEVLRDLDLTIEAGEVFGFLGHRGAGKTTTVNTLTTLTRRTCGSTGTSPRGGSSNSSASFRGRRPAW